MNKVTTKLFMLALACLLFPYCAAAEGDFPCLKGSTGSTLDWSASWQNDRSDDQVAYRVNEILHFKTNSSYSVVLKLAATAKAAKTVRHLPISSAAFASTVCKNLKKSSRRKKLAAKTVKDIRKSTAPKQKAKKPEFIKYLRQGWVRADLPRTQIPLDTCEISGKEFLCLEEEKMRFGEQLQLVAEQIEIQPTLSK